METLAHLQPGIGNKSVLRLLRQAASASDEPLLTSGAQGEAVRRAQELLSDAGGDLAADGIFGPVTRRAVSAFQAAADLPADGVIGPNTWTALRAGVTRFRMPRPTVREGSTGNTVSRAQLLLNATGADLATDGVFGPLTRSAVEHYQEAAHLAADGVVGPTTWAALQAGTARATGGTSVGGPDTLEGLRDRLASVREALRAAIGSVAGEGRPRPAQSRSADTAVAPNITRLTLDVATALDEHATTLGDRFGDEVAALDSLVTSMQGQLPAPGPEVGELSGGLDAVAAGLSSKATLGKPVTSRTPTGSTTITVQKGTPITFDADTYDELYAKLDQRAQQGLESGRTQSQISDFDFEGESAPGGGVRVKRATVEVTETVEGCDWPQVGNACAADQKQWETYEKAIDTHEFGHVGVDKQAFANAHKRLVGLTGTDEADLETKVNAELNTIEDEAEADNNKWHGTPAGKVPALPPSSC